MFAAHASQKIAMERVSCCYTPHPNRFEVPSKLHEEKENNTAGGKKHSHTKKAESTTSDQFFHLYRSRLHQLKERLVQRAFCVLKDDHVPVRTVPEMKEDEKCLVVGTIVKQQEQRPSVLKQMCDEIGESLQTVGDKWYVSDNDTVLLEDDHLSVQIQGKVVDAQRLVTGVTVAAYGVNTSGGIFDVEKLIFPSIGPQKPLKQAAGEPKYVMFVSALEFNSSGENGDLMVACKVLLDFITGLSGDESLLSTCTSRICRLIVAGHSISTRKEDAEFNRLASYQTRSMDPPSVKAMKLLDTFLAELTPVIPVDLMPGGDDPTNHLWPQSPLHKCTLPLAGAYGSQLNLVSNPYEAEYDSCLLVGTSGANLHDIRRNSRLGSSSQVLREIYRWQQLCPTAPDTLDCQPLVADLFTLCPKADSPCPHVIFAGNQDECSYKLVKHVDGQRTLLLGVPSFARTKQAVLLDINSLNVQVVTCNP